MTYRTRSKADYVSSSGVPVRWNARGGEAIAGNLGRDASGQFTNVGSGSDSGLSREAQRLLDKRRRREEAKKKPAKASASRGRDREREPEKTREQLDATGATSFEKMGYSKSDFASLTDIADNVPENADKYKKMVDDGIAEVVNGKLVLTSAGKAVLAAARSGRVGDAKEILARDAQRRADQKKRDDEAQAKRDADEQAKRDAESKPKKGGGGGGGGKKKPEKKPTAQKKPGESGNPKQEQGDKFVSAIRQIDKYLADNKDLPADDPNKLSPKEVKMLREKRTEFEAGIKDLTGQSYAKYAQGTDARTKKLISREVVKLRKKLADKTLSKAVRARYRKQMSALNTEYANIKKRQSGSTSKEKKPWPRNKPQWKKIYAEVQRRNPGMSSAQVHAIANRKYSEGGGAWMTIDVKERLKRTEKAYPFTARQRRRFMVAQKHASHDQSTHGQRGGGGGSVAASRVVASRSTNTDGIDDMFADQLPPAKKPGKTKFEQASMFGEAEVTPARPKPKFADALPGEKTGGQKIPTNGIAKQVLGDSLNADGTLNPDVPLVIPQSSKTRHYPDTYEAMTPESKAIVDHVVATGVDGVPIDRVGAAKRVAQMQTEMENAAYGARAVERQTADVTREAAEQPGYTWVASRNGWVRSMPHHDEKHEWNTGRKTTGIGSNQKVELRDVRNVDMAPGSRERIASKYPNQVNDYENAGILYAAASYHDWRRSKMQKETERAERELQRSQSSIDVFGEPNATPGQVGWLRLQTDLAFNRTNWLYANADALIVQAHRSAAADTFPTEKSITTKHASHDQSSHGRRGSRGASYAGAYRYARRGGATHTEARQFAKEAGQIEGDRLRAERDAKRAPKQPSIAEAQRALRAADDNVVKARAELARTENLLAKQLASDSSPIIKEQWRQRAIRQQRDLDNAEQQRADAQAEVQKRRDARNQPAPTTGKPARVAPDGKIGLAGTETDAFGVNPADRYKLQHRIVDMGDLKASNTLTGAINPDYDPALQPRDRSRASSQNQIDKLAKRMIPEYMTEDMRRIDTGSPIIDAEGNILSGNGRVIAMQRQIDTPDVYPGKADAMRAEAIKAAERLGIDPAEVAKMKNPVVVRLLDDPNVDEVSFAKEANSSGTLRMSPMEQARVDAQDLAPDFGTRMDIGDGTSIDMALRSRTNKPLIAEFIDTVPENERGSILTAEGDLNPMGMYRLKAAIFTQTFPTEQGQRMARSLLDSVEPDLVSVQTGIAGSLPAISRAAALTRTGKREADLDPAVDIAMAVDTLARVRAAPQFEAAKPANRVDVFLDQDNMFTGNKKLVIDLTPQQKVLLRHVNAIASKPRVVRSFFNEIARMIEDTPAPGQGGLFSDAPSATLESIYDRAFTAATTRGE